MYVVKDGREVKLIVSESGDASLAEEKGKPNRPIEKEEAESLLVDRLNTLRSKMLSDTVHKGTDSFRLESLLRHYCDRVVDVNNLLRLLEVPAEQDLSAIIEASSDVIIESAEKPAQQKKEKTTTTKAAAPKKEQKLVIAKRKKVVRGGIVPVRVPEYNTLEQASA